MFIHLNGFYAISGHDAPIKEAVKRWNEFSGQPTDEASLNAAVAQWRQKCGLTDVDEDEKHEEAGGTHHHHHHQACDVQKEVTAILVNMKGDSMTAAAMFSGEMKRGHKVQAVNPILPMQRLMSDILGNVRTVLVVLTGLIIVVSGVGIFVSIYNSMSDRRKEIAIMRALAPSAAPCSRSSWPNRFSSASAEVSSAFFWDTALSSPPPSSSSRPEF